MKSLALAALLFSTILAEAFAIDCYECNGDCDDIESNGNLITCSDFYNACRQEIHKFGGPDSVNIFRYCGIAEEPKCEHKDFGTSHISIYCTCKTDGCNHDDNCMC